jgi:predicted small secreted protein
MIEQPDRLAGRRKTKMLKNVLLALAAGSLALAASACNTVRGVGQDLESAANSVDRAT